MKNILFLCACLLALAAPLRAAVAPPADIVVVQVFCEFGRPINAVITRGGASEVVDLKYKRPATDRRAMEESIQSNETYYKLCQQFYQEGYILQSTMSVPVNSTSSYNTLFFVKAR